MKILTQNQSINSLEISELVQSRHDNVKRAIERLAIAKIVVLPPVEEVSFLDSIGRAKNTTAYIFTGEQGKLDSITVVAQLCPQFTAALVKRWYELEQKIQKPAELSRMELIQLALEAEQENQALRGQVAVLEPKAQALDTIANTENTYCIRECAKTIGIKESDLIQLLLDKKWCYRDADRKLQPMAQYVTNGVFANRASPVIKNRNDGKERVFLHMRVTAFGLTRITGLVERSKKLKVVA